jgi:adenine specific DNA methylase Mod
LIPHFLNNHNKFLEFSEYYQYLYRSNKYHTFHTDYIFSKEEHILIKQKKKKNEETGIINLWKVFIKIKI